MTLYPRNPLQDMFDEIKREGFDPNKLPERSGPSERGKVLAEKNFVKVVDKIEVPENMLEFWVKLIRWESKGNARYVASVEFPTYIATQIDLPNIDFRRVYNNIVERARQGDYNISITPEGLVNIEFD